MRKLVITLFILCLSPFLPSLPPFLSISLSFPYVMQCCQVTVGIHQVALTEARVIKVVAQRSNDGGQNLNRTEIAVDLHDKQEINHRPTRGGVGGAYDLCLTHGR